MKPQGEETANDFIGNSGSSGNGGGSGKQSGNSGGDFAENGLKAHNMFRKIHGAPDMELDEEMTKSAEEYAKKLAKMGTLQHSSSDERSGNGENLAMKCSSLKGDEMSAEEATKNWSVFCTWFYIAIWFLGGAMFCELWYPQC